MDEDIVRLEERVRKSEARLLTMVTGVSVSVAGISLFIAYEGFLGKPAAVKHNLENQIGQSKIEYIESAYKTAVSYNKGVPHFQSGIVYFDETSDVELKKIKFDPPFSESPEIIIGLKSIDINLATSVDKVEETKKLKFDIERIKLVLNICISLAIIRLEETPSFFGLLMVIEF